jgi:dienelactone hydrolase
MDSLQRTAVPVLVNRQTFDENAPTKTMLPGREYFLFLPGRFDSPPEIQITAHGASGTTAAITIPTTVTPRDPAGLIDSPPADSGGFSHIEPVSGGKYALLLSEPYDAGVTLRKIEVSNHHQIGQVIFLRQLKSYPYNSVSLSGNLLLIGGSQLLVIVDVAAWKILESIDFGWPRSKTTRAIAAIPGGNVALARSPDCLKLVDLQNRKLIPGSLDLPCDDTGMSPVAFTPDGELALLGCGSQIQFVRLPAGGPVLDGTLEIGDVIFSIAVSPNGKLAAVAANGERRFVDIVKRQIVRKCRFFQCAAFLSDDWVLLSRGSVELAYQQMVAMDVTTGQFSKDLPAEEIARYNQFAAGHEHLIAKSLFCAGMTWPGVFVSDDQRALDYLAARPEVDATRIGCAGLSGGGLRTVMLTGADERIRCSCCVGMITTWRDYLLQKSYTHTWMVYVPGLPHDLDYPEVLGISVPNPVLVLNNRQDALFTMPEMQRADAILTSVYQKAKAPERYRASFYDGPHKFDRDMQKEALESRMILARSTRRCSAVPLRVQPRRVASSSAVRRTWAGDRVMSSVCAITFIYASKY